MCSRLVVLALVYVVNTEVRISTIFSRIFNFLFMSVFYQAIHLRILFADFLNENTNIII